MSTELVRAVFEENAALHESLICWRTLAVVGGLGTLVGAVATLLMRFM